MEFKIAKEVFSQGLSRVQSIVEKRTTLPILTNVLLETKTDAVQLVATDLEVGLKGLYPAEIVKEGTITVPAKLLSDMVSRMPEGEMIFRVLENDFVEIKSGKAKFKVPAITADDYPILPDYENETFISLPAELLGDMVEKIFHAVGADESRPYLNGAYMQTEEVDGVLKLRLVSTDGHRLAISEKDVEKEASLSIAGVIIPRKGLGELRKALESRDGDLEICFTERNVVVRMKSLLFIIRLIDGSFPDYKAVVPRNNNRVLTCSRDELHAILRRVVVVTEHSTIGVRFAFSKRLVQITCENPSVGDLKEEMAVTYDGEDFEIGFNARYLLDTLEVIKDEDVILAFDLPTSPVLLKSPSDVGFSSIVMPMRL